MMMGVEHMCLLLCFLLSVQGQKQGTFPASDYYWPMTKTTHRVMSDVEMDAVEAELHGVKFIENKRFGDAVSLTGPWSWIDVDAGITKDCLAFRFSSCNDEQAITIHFWLRIRKAKRILATGSYTNSTEGPGLLIEYEDASEMLHVNFASKEKKWSTSIRLPRHSWCHVTASWDIDTGLLVVLDGKIDDPVFKANDFQGKKQVIEGKPYRKMITIGRDDIKTENDPLNHFDMSHLVIYFRTVTKEEIDIFPKVPLKAATIDVIAQCKKKQADPCYVDPCSSRDCDIEKKYSDYVCLNTGLRLRHPVCREAWPGNNVKPTVEKPSDKKTENPTDTNTGVQPFVTPKVIKIDCRNLKANMLPDEKGCGNIQRNGQPFCKDQQCFYGTCRARNDIKKCQCPECHSFKRYQQICGNDGLRYENMCVMKRASCLRKRLIKQAKCDDVIGNATHYWPLNETTGSFVKDINGKARTQLHNDIVIKKYSKLGLGHVLDIRDKGWVDIKGLQDTCISTLTCPQGISVGFWINFSDGDYILAAGGYAEQEKDKALPPGFRLRRDEKERSLFQFELATSSNVWKLSFKEFKKQWVFTTFTWSKSSGLKLYFDSKLMYSSNTQHNIMNLKRNLIKQRDSPVMMLARHDVHRLLPNNGKFEMAHLAIWKKALTPIEVRKVYAGTINRTEEVDVCCYRLQHWETVYRTCDKFKKVAKKCICPELDIENMLLKCKANIPSPLAVCEDTLKDCASLMKEQNDVCSTPLVGKCSKSCNRCLRSPLASAAPKNHFSQKALIFSTLGCIGGLILLLGITFYFWKIYRTRYHGAFVPPVKTVSLLDVSDYDEEKWPNKYIDSSTYFIKDVPPKKRALPLIPARNTQISHGVRYQPPDFD